MTIFLYGIAAGAILTNLYWQLYRTGFGRRHFTVAKSHNTYKYLLSTHFRGQTRDGKKFVYCPAGVIVSWSAGDYDHEWCHYCERYFSEHVEQLLDPSEQDRRLP